MDNFSLSKRNEIDGIFVATSRLKPPHEIIKKYNDDNFSLHTKCQHVEWARYNNKHAFINQFLAKPMCVLYFFKEQRKQNTLERKMTLSRCFTIHLAIYFGWKCTQTFRGSYKCAFYKFLVIF